MKQIIGKEKVCQFYVVIGCNDFIKPINDGNVYIVVTDGMDIKTINDNILNKYYEMQNLKLEVNNKIIFLIPDKAFEASCYELMRILNLNGGIQYISEYESQKLASRTNMYERTNLYYLDENNFIWDKYGNFIGENGKDGVWIDYNTNKLISDGKIKGYVDMSKNTGGHGSMSGGGAIEADTTSLNKSPKVLTLKPPAGGRSAAFVSLPIIMFVLSAMLLIGSIILLFVLE